MKHLLFAVGKPFPRNLKSIEFAGELLDKMNENAECGKGAERKKSDN